MVERRLRRSAPQVHFNIFSFVPCTRRLLPRYDACCRYTRRVPTRPASAVHHPRAEGWHACGGELPSFRWASFRLPVLSYRHKQRHLPRDCADHRTLHTRTPDRVVCCTRVAVRYHRAVAPSRPSASRRTVVTCDLGINVIAGLEQAVSEHMGDLFWATNIHVVSWEFSSMFMVFLPRQDVRAPLPPF